MRAAVRGFVFLDELPKITSGQQESSAVQVLAGPSDGPGEESFDVLLCTPAWVAREVASKGIFSAQHLVVMDEIDHEVAKKFLTRIFESVEGVTWNDVATLLSIYGRWEFEGYVGRI